MSTDHPHHAEFLPAMGHGGPQWLYAPLIRLLGVPRVHRELVARADIRPGHQVLEIGCGPGELLAAVLRAGPAVEVTGLDPDPDALARARRRTARVARGGRPVRLDRGKADALPYPDESVDRVLSSFMLHHLAPDEQQRALVEVARVLRPGGQLHVVDVDAGGSGPLAHRVRAHGNQADVPALLHAAGLTDVATATGRTVVGTHVFQRAVRR